ncbi:hypothetical protein ILYODFUR_010347 [Ilyodon furcidens]|uniref:Uncharacterized protein n=1 Tax=Ilyodon furcidens TaxID=33524 RepID=A0ABV0UHZ7_9TELE
MSSHACFDMFEGGGRSGKQCFGRKEKKGLVAQRAANGRPADRSIMASSPSDSFCASVEKADYAKVRFTARHHQHHRHHLSNIRRRRPGVLVIGARPAGSLQNITDPLR